MPKYLFVYDEKNKSFPERIRVVVEGEDADALQQSEDLTATVLNTEAIELLEKLMARCEAEPTYRAELIDAPFWEFIEKRFKPAEAEAAQLSGKAKPHGSVV